MGVQGLSAFQTYQTICYVFHKVLRKLYKLYKFVSNLRKEYQTTATKLHCKQFSPKCCRCLIMFCIDMQVFQRSPLVIHRISWIIRTWNSRSGWSFKDVKKQFVSREWNTTINWQQKWFSSYWDDRQWVNIKQTLCSRISWLWKKETDSWGMKLCNHISLQPYIQMRWLSSHCHFWDESHSHAHV